MLHDCLASISISTNTTVPNFFFAIKFHFRETIFNSWIHTQVDKVAIRWWRWTTTTTSPATRKVKEIERDEMRKKNKNRRRHDDGIKEEIESLSIPSKNVNSHNSCFFFLLLLFPIVAAAAVCKRQNKTKKNLSQPISRWKYREKESSFGLIDFSPLLAHWRNFTTPTTLTRTAEDTRENHREESESQSAPGKKIRLQLSDLIVSCGFFFLSFFYFASRESS